MTFQQFKLKLMHLTGLERDALHIYVGIATFLLTLTLLRKLIQSQRTRLTIALMMATLFAFAGEYLDLRANYPNLTGTHLENSIHDIINTCFWPYVLYAINRWTSLFQSPHNKIHSF